MRRYTSEEIDRWFAVLAQHERRCIVDFLRRREVDRVPVRDIVSHLQRSDTARDERDEIAMALHHIHLPKLATADVLDFDPSSGTVRYRGNELVERLLESTPETHIPNG